MNILFLGPQGSGKGTQAHLVKDRYKMDYFDSGAFLREQSTSNPEIAAILKSGELLTDDVVNELVENHLSVNNLFDNIVFDGFPRRVSQLAALQKYLAEKGNKLDYTIFLNIPEEETVKRLSARRIDQKTGEIYNLITNPPGADVDQANLIQRTDDYPEAIRERLSAYHKDTEPLVEELRKSTNFIEIDGTQTIEKIHQDIVSALDNSK